MFTSQFVNTPDGITLKLFGDLTIEDAKELKALCVKLKGDSGHLSLDLSEIGVIDIAGFQVLCSAHKTWCRAGKNILYTEGTLDALARTAKESGYFRNTGCMPPSQGQCLWTGGSHE